MGKQNKYQFLIVKNYPESLRYELFRKPEGMFDPILRALGLKKEAF